MKRDLRRSIIIGVEVARQMVQHLAANSAALKSVRRLWAAGFGVGARDHDFEKADEGDSSGQRQP